MAHTIRSAADDLMTTPEAARLLGVSVQRIHDLLRAGVLPVAMRIPNRVLLLRADVEQLARERSANPPRAGRPKGSPNRPKAVAA